MVIVSRHGAQLALVGIFCGFARARLERNQDLQGYDANFGALLDELYPFRVIRLSYNILVATRPSAVFPSLDRVGS
jgi:hypothetical protein